MYDNYGCLITTTVFTEENNRESTVLKSDGSPFILEKVKNPIGFKLTKQEKNGQRG